MCGVLVAYDKPWANLIFDLNANVIMVEYNAQDHADSVVCVMSVMVMIATWLVIPGH